MIPEWKFADARMPTGTEQKNLARLMYVAFLDLRILSREGRSQQAKDLAEAFHNIPLLMHTPGFSFTASRDFLGNYQHKYEGQLRFDYLQSGRS
ncbi:MAG: hypothetical protein HZA89_07560 [Verrucomicrobia bacterium]|nr:hypothetical protein [Verrucomicrobiota bacterium]